MTFKATTEDAIDIGDIDYEWQLTEASKKLESFVQKFALYQIGLTNDVAEKVCPESNIELYGCIESTIEEYVQLFYQDCIDYIVEIFPRGRTDLKTILGNFTTFIRMIKFSYLELFEFQMIHIFLIM